MRYVRYAANRWGVGEAVLDGEVLVHHDPPRAPGACGSEPRTPLTERFRAYFDGARDEFRDVRIDTDGFTPFQLAVCEALRAVPYGEVVTYGELAALAGYPNAHRAAGTFCAHNRFSIVVPCHRVVGSTGIGSYGASGVTYKRRLLELEGVAL